MLKHNQAVVSLLATLAVLPALAGDRAAPKDLARSLDATVRSLEIMSGFRTDPPTLPDAVEFVRASTETPIADARVRDDLLVRLRDEVNGLESLYGDLVQHGPTTLAAKTSAADAMPVASHRPRTAGDASEADAAARASERASAFTADPVREARAQFLAGRHERCLAVADKLADPGAQYWCARALEALGRFDEALARYRTVSESKLDEALAARAKEDLAHLEWKQRFAKKLGALESGAAPSSAGASSNGAGAHTSDASSRDTAKEGRHP